MGAWGLGSFENDAALDWADELEGARSLAPVRRALERALRSRTPDVELDDACAALAAAEVVAALNLAPPADLPEDVEEWVNTHPLAITQETLDLALRAVARVGEASDLRDLIEVDGTPDQEWRTNLADLEARLRRPPNPDAMRVIRERAVLVRRARAARPRPRVGDLLWAPLEEGVGVVLIVLHVHAIWKDAMHVGIFAGRTFSTPEDIRPDLLAPPYLVPAQFTFTSSVAWREWLIVGHEPDLTRHFALPIIGGGACHHATRGDVVVGRYGPPRPTCPTPGCVEAPEISREELLSYPGLVFSPTIPFTHTLRRIFLEGWRCDAQGRMVTPGSHDAVG